MTIISRLRRHGPLAGLLALALGAGAAAAGPAVAGSPSRQVDTGVSSYNDVLMPLAGSVQALVYRQARAEARGSGSATAPGHRRVPDAYHSSVVVQPPTGDAKLIGTMPVGHDGWSLVGHLLAAYDKSDRAADWWNITTGSHGRLTVPSNQTYVGAGPGSVVTVSGRTMYEHPVHGGHVTSRRLPGIAGGGWPGDQGVVVPVGYKLYFLPWSASAAAVPLQKGTNGEPESCSAPTQGYTACVLFQLHQGDTVPALIAVDGGPATTGPANGLSCGGGDWLTPATSGAAMVFVDDSQPDCQPGTLGVISAGATTAHDTGIVPGALTGVVSALGAGVATTSDYAQLRAVTTTGTLAVAGPITSPATVAAFGLGGSELVDIDDAATSSATDTVRVRSVSVRSGTARVGAASAVAELPQGAISSLGALAQVAVHGMTIAYEIGSNLHVVRGTSDRLLKVHAGSTLIGAGNRWVAYHDNYVVQHHGPVVVADTRTGATHQIVGHAYSASYDGGRYLSYTGKTGIHLVDLTTGHRRRVSRTPEPAFVTGHWIAWNTRDRQGRLQDDRHPSRTLRLAREVMGLSPAGALLCHRCHSTYEEPASAQRPVDTAVWLHRWNGATHRVLSRRMFQQVPQASGHVIAWIGIGGDLFVRPL